MFIFCIAQPVYAYSVAAVKFSPDGDTDWNYIIGDQNYGGMDLDMAYDGSKFIYLSTTELIRINKYGTDDISKEISSYYLTPDMEGYIYFLESFDNVAKVDSSLSYLWKTDYSTFEPDYLCVNSENKLIVIGYYSPENGSFIKNYVVKKYNEDGDVLWTIDSFPGFNIRIINAFVTITDHLMLLAYINDYVAIILYDDTGILESEFYIDDISREYAIIDSFINIYLSELGVWKYSLDGELKWHFSKNEITVKEMSLDSDENIIGIGTVPYDFQKNDPENLVTFKLDPDGNLLWWKKYERESVSAKRLLVDSEDNVIVTGYEGKKDVEIPYDTKFFALKLDPDGELLWHETYQPFEGYSAFASDATLDDENNIYIAGYSYDYTDGDDDDDEPGCGCF